MLFVYSFIVWLGCVFCSWEFLCLLEYFHLCLVLFCCVSWFVLKRNVGCLLVRSSCNIVVMLLCSSMACILDFGALSLLVWVFVEHVS